jgi:hypothetical protein
LYCNDCKTEFEQTPAHLLEGHLGCGCMQKSIGEDLINKYLFDNKVNYKRQFRIKECRNKKPLPFDFVIFNDNNEIHCLIEFQGKQHYTNTHWSSDENESLKSFEELQINDNIKRNFCLEHNIKLIEIPYWEISKIKRILDKVIIKE